jgi:predicted transcriptional regulator YdeE
MKKIALLIPTLLTCGMTSVIAADVEQQPKENEMNVEPRIITKQLLMVGVESAPIDFASDFDPVLKGLYQRVRDKLGEMKGVVEPARMIGFWQPYGVYFAGVEVTVKHAPEGLTIKDLPESLYAVFIEQKRGTVGSPQGYAYKWLKANLDTYQPNEKVAGDFELYRNLVDTQPDQEAEIWIPIKLKNAFRDIAEAKAAQKELEIFKMPACRVIGKEASLPLHGEDPMPAHPLWEACMKSGDWKMLMALPQVIKEKDSCLGWTCDYVAATDTFSYLVSALTPAGTPVPEGCQFRDVPETLVAVGAWGDEIGDIAGRLKDMGLEAAWGVAGCGWNAELYFFTEQENPPPNGNKVGCRWMVPCKRAQ